MAQREPIKNFSAEDIRRYHAGELSAQERHELEKAALDDPLLADALEGYAYTPSPVNDIAELQQRLQQKMEEQKLVPVSSILTKHFGWWRMVALLLLLAGAGWIVFQWNRSNETNIALRVPNEKEEKAEATENTLTDTSALLPKDSFINSNVAAAAPPAEETRKEKATQSQLTSKAPASTKTQSTADKNIAARNETIAAKNRDTTQAPGASVLQKTAPAATTAQKPNLFRGQVVDRYNNPLANVSVNANKTGTVTDINGTFSITISDTVLSATVSSVGFKPQKINIKNTGEEQRIVLEPTGEALSEVVVTGYGKERGNAARRILQENNTASAPAGGWSRFNEYITKSRKPAEALGIGPVTGAVTLSFTINKQGRPQQVEVEKSLCAACDAEAVRLLKEGPDWVKGKEKKVYWSLEF